MSGRFSIPANIWWEIWDILVWFSGPSHSLHLYILTLFSNDEYWSNRCGLSNGNLGWTYSLGARFYGLNYGSIKYSTYPEKTSGAVRYQENIQSMISLLNVAMAIWLAINTKIVEMVPVLFCFYRTVTQTVYRWYTEYKLLKFKQFCEMYTAHVNMTMTINLICIAQH